MVSKRKKKKWKLRENFMLKENLEKENKVGMKQSLVLEKKGIQESNG